MPERVEPAEAPGILEVNSPSWGTPDDGAVERLAAALGEHVVQRTLEHRGELTVIVPAGRIADVLTFLRDHEGYDFFSDVTAIDYLGYEGLVAGYWGDAGGRDLNRMGSWGKRRVPERPGDKRFALSYHLAKVRTVAPGGHRRLRVQVWVDDGEAVPSVVPVYPSADFHEREAWDMFGIPFDGHPNLRRLLMPDDWGGHPQRKDYPLGGEPAQFTVAE